MQGKYLKKYNEETREWELISAPDVSVIQQLASGADITDTNVIVTNYQYAETGETTLNDTLGIIGDDIAKLKRNVSWLAEHGGGGSGGGGTQQSYGIVLVSPTLQNGAIYTANDTLSIKFMITGGTSGDICKYSVTYDSYSSGYTEIEVNKEISLTFDNSKSSLMTHSMTINATNPFNNTITPLSFYIYISKFTVVNDTSINIPGSIQYLQGIYNVSINYTDAYIPLKVQCGLLNAVITINATWNDTVKTFTYTSTTTDIQSKNIPLWEIIGEGVINNLYIIDFTAQAQYGDMPAITADSFRISVKVINPNQLAIISTVNAQTSSQEITVPYKEIMSYVFTFLGPKTISNVKYASKIKNGDNQFLINGSKYYDESLKESGCTYLSNDSTTMESTISKNYTINEGFAVGDTPELYIKGWSYDGEYTAETKFSLRVIAQSTNIFPRQINAQTLFASWNNEYNFTDKDIWKSNISDYNYLYNGYSSLSGICNNILKVYNTNENSGLISTSGLLNLRLQNRAYAKIDVSEYNKEIEFISGAISRAEHRGFTISFTFYSDLINNNSCILLWGNNNSDGSLNYGFKIKSNKVYWSFFNGNGGYDTISANIPYEVKTTVDFVYDAINHIVLIYINGMPNAAKDLSDVNGLSSSYFLPSEIYIGCDYYNNNVTDFSDINVYEFNILTSLLNDMQINVNGKNAKLNGLPSETSVITDYNTWKKKNFIYTKEGQETIPLSYFFNTNGEYITDFDEKTVNYIKTNSNIPTILLKYNSEFTEDVFFKPASKETAEKTYACTVKYYKPNTSGNGKECNFSGYTSLQGTSTLGYRVKNLELYTDGTFDSETKEHIPTMLFQPIDKWFPESEFTLKADIVDSSHANNAVIGEWINNANLFDNTPPMDSYNENTAPKDIDLDGNIIKTLDPETQKETDYHREVSIKHTLEGFPVLLFISFPNKSTYQLIGIYSFNLGRNSYYNMGMKFLKNFCKRDSYGDLQSCPCNITKWEESETLGSIKSSEIYSFEFINNKIEAAGGQTFIPLWTQYNEGILSKMGEFKYPSSISSEIWNNLKSMFQTIACCPTGRYESKDIWAYQGFNNMLAYYVDAQGNVVTNGDKISQEDSNYSNVKNVLHLNNFYAYYVIANSFGLTDSLGKNLVLKTWDNGNTWWPCFYDMDTALGLENTGSDNVPVNCFIDKFICSSDTTNRITYTGITYHYIDSKYAAADAKIWGLMRDLAFHYANDGTDGRYYEKMWAKLRYNDGKLSKHTTFIEAIGNKINTCGELVYCKDYYSKYITKGDGTTSSLQFLHGNRIEFINDWLKKHFYFLDGMLNAKNYWSSEYTFTSSDTPLYNDSFAWAFYYTSSEKIPFTFRALTPCFITLNTNNQSSSEKYYIESSDSDTVIYYPNKTAANTQTVLYGSTLLTKFSGLNASGFRQIMNDSVAGALYQLKEVNISNNTIIDVENPLNSLSQFIKNDYSGAETINFSNMKYTSSYEGAKSFSVDFKKFVKILYLDINNSDISSLVLPQTSLQTLNIANSSIVSFDLKNQNIISSISFEGCNKLTNINFDNCNAIQSLVISNKPNLTDFSIYNCSGITSLTITNNAALTNITISNNSNLKELIIEGGSSNFKLNISKCSSLSTLKLNNIKSTNPINIDSQSAKNIKIANFDNYYNLAGISYDGEDVETYKDTYVLDLSPMEFIEESSFSNITNLSYLRVPNYNDEEHHAFKVKSNMFYASSLKRIFGYIDIAEGNVFYNKSGFYLNDLDSTFGDDKSYKEWQEDETKFVPTSKNKYFTNIIISSTSLDNEFNGTNCNLGDVYYVLRNCTSAVTSLSRLFNGCTNIYTDNDNNLNKNIFDYCTNVTNIDYIFNGCTNIKGRIDDKIMDTISDTVTTFNYVFPNGLFFNIDHPLFNSANTITEIGGFSPIFDNNLYPFEPRSINANILLPNLKYLVKIENSFNTPTQIQYTNEETETGSPCELLKDLTSLKQIIKSFNTKTDTDCYNLICDKNNLDKYSTKLEEISNSFNIETNNNMQRLFIGNSFLSSCKNSIKTIANSFDGSILKCIDLNDCDGLYFPYKIFSGCTKLEIIKGFFKGLVLSEITGFDDECNPKFDNGYTTITLPSYINGNTRIDIFGDCIKLTNISTCFKGMKYGFYKLVPNGFKNNSLEYINELFSESGATECWKIGSIPYHLLYQEKDGKINATIKNMSYIFENTNSSSVTCYSLSSITNTLGFEDLYEDNENYRETTAETKYKWNIYLHDGTKELEGFITSQTNYIRLQELYEIIEESGSTEGYEDLLDEYDKPILPLELPSEIIETYTGRSYELLTHEDIGYAENTTEYNDTVKEKYFAIRNYICAPDIFKYCQNGATTLIDGIFKKCSEGIVNGSTADGYPKGYYGTIPPFLLKPLSNITSISSLFENFKQIIPHKWATVSESTVTSGIMYSEIFKYNTNIKYLTSIFKDSNIMGRLSIKSIFDGLTLLSSVSSFWERCSWFTSNIDEVIFNSCYKLNNISNLFKGNGPSKISDLFSTVKDNITICAGFMDGNTTTCLGTIPPFWDYPKLKSSARESLDQIRSAYRNVNAVWNYTLADHPEFTTD